MIERRYVSQCISSDYCKGWNDAVDAMGGWIPVTERLPEKEGRYLCVKRIGKSGAVYVTMMNGDSYGFSMEHIYTDEVTHWMPLPEPPKEDAE